MPTTTPILTDLLTEQTKGYSVAQLCSAMDPLERLLFDYTAGIQDYFWSMYADDPIRFSEEVLRSTLTNQQKDVLYSVRHNQITVVKSANAVGKTFIGADLALWFARCLPMSKVITAAAPPLENLKMLLWGEIGRRILDNPELFRDARPKKLNLEFEPDWWLTGVAIPRDSNAATLEAKFSGKHAPYLLFICDEGDAIPDAVYRGIESCMSGGFVRLVVFFNPRLEAGPVVDLINKKSANVITLDAFSHPNVLTGRNVIPGAVSQKVTIQRIVQMTSPVPDDTPLDDSSIFAVPHCLAGRRTRLPNGDLSEEMIAGQRRKVVEPEFAYKVLARYPHQQYAQVIPQGLIKKAQERWILRAERVGWNIPPKLIFPTQGVDVAEFGNNANVSTLRYVDWVAEQKTWGGMDPVATGKKAALIAQETGALITYFDAIGLGAGSAPAAIDWFSRPDNWPDYSIDELAEKARQLELEGDAGLEWVSILVDPSAYLAVGTKVSRAATEELDADGIHDEMINVVFANKRAQLLWRVRMWLKTDLAMLPPDKELAEELAAHTYTRVGEKDMVVVFSKDKVKKLIGRSPDKSDSLILTFDEDGIELGWV